MDDAGSESQTARPSPGRPVFVGQMCRPTSSTHGTLRSAGFAGHGPGGPAGVFSSIVVGCAPDAGSAVDEQPNNKKPRPRPVTPTPRPRMGTTCFRAAERTIAYRPASI